MPRVFASRVFWPSCGQNPMSQARNTFCTVFRIQSNTRLGVRRCGEHEALFGALDSVGFDGKGGDKASITRVGHTVPVGSSACEVERVCG